MPGLDKQIHGWQMVGARISLWGREVWISDRETRINEPCGNDVGNVSMNS